MSCTSSIVSTITSYTPSPLPHVVPQVRALRMTGYRLMLLVSWREAERLLPLIVLLQADWRALGFGRGLWVGHGEHGSPGQRAEAAAEPLLQVWPR